VEHVRSLAVAKTDDGSVFAFLGAAPRAIAAVSDALDMALPLPVYFVWPMLKIAKESHISVPSMCVSDLALGFLNGCGCVNN